VNEITAITPQVKDKSRCNIFVDGRFCCGLTLETVVKNRLKVGLQVTAETLEEMQLESEKETALNKALYFLSATRKTEKEVRSHLAKKGYLPAVVDYAVDKLRSYLKTVSEDPEFMTSVLNLGDGVAVSVYLGKTKDKNV